MNLFEKLLFLSTCPHPPLDWARRLAVALMLGAVPAIFPTPSLCLEPDTHVLLLKSGDAGVYDDVHAQTRKRLRELCNRHDGECPGLHLDAATATELQSGDDTYDLVITLGLKAGDYARREPAGKEIINAMIPRGAYLASPAAREDLDHTTLLLDQPPDRSLLLIKSLIPNATRIGFLYSPKNSPLQASLADHAEALGLELISDMVYDEAQIGKKLSLMFGKIDVLLALPDIEIHNRKHVPNILLSTYRNRIPLVAFSAAYVKAGALAAVYSAPGDIAEQLAELIMTRYSRQPVPRGVIHPKYFSVSINRRVAHSLALEVPARAAVIEARIRETEK